MSNLVVPVLAISSLAGAMVAAVALAIACSLLSVFVVSKRWAFIGEGIAHAGFGGAGMAWLLGAMFPGVAMFRQDSVVYAIATVFCLVVALIVGAFTRNRGGGRRAEVDTVIGIFMVASLAWGFIAYAIYWRVVGHRPLQFETYLGFEQLRVLTTQYVVMAVVASLGVVAAVWAAWKELLFYGTDERQAEASGVNVGLVHYGLILLLAVVIVIGMKLMGTVLVVAMLVLPGATGLAVGRTTRGVWATSVAAGVIGAAGGVGLNGWLRYLPEGPAIVLVLFAVFCVALAAGRLLRVQ